MLVGVGSLLRIYDFGKRKMLRKCECKQLPNRVMHISTQGDRIYVGDVAESFFFCMYKSAEVRKFTKTFAISTMFSYLC
jgi:splicing factor 3B subunit 3